LVGACKSRTDRHRRELPETRPKTDGTNIACAAGDGAFVLKVETCSSKVGRLAAAATSGLPN
jgi:hypothetical protein